MSWRLVIPAHPPEFGDKFPIKRKLKLRRTEGLEDPVGDISRQKENKLSIPPKMINNDGFQTFSRGFSAFHIYGGSSLTDLADATPISQGWGKCFKAPQMFIKNSHEA